MSIGLAVRDPRLIFPDSTNIDLPDSRARFVLRHGMRNTLHAIPGRAGALSTAKQRGPVEFTYTADLDPYSFTSTAALYTWIESLITALRDNNSFSFYLYYDAVGSDNLYFQSCVADSWEFEDASTAERMPEVSQPSRIVLPIIATDPVMYTGAAGTPVSYAPINSYADAAYTDTEAPFRVWRDKNGVVVALLTTRGNLYLRGALQDHTSDFSEWGL